MPSPHAPVEFIPGDVPDRVPTGGVALCLSGGGYRAMLFHAGALIRFNEAGLLPILTKVSSVSGGSIIAGLLGLKWSRLQFNEAGVAARLMEEVIAPVRALAERTIDIPAILLGLLPWSTISGRIASYYRRYLFRDATLQDLPNAPLFVLNATNLQSGALCRFTKAYLWDYRVGKVANPSIALARAVAASSAFPPFLSPARFAFNPTDFAPGTGKDLQEPPYTTRLLLTDGGVYDNLGLETAWKSCATVFVSDGGGQLRPAPRPQVDWIQGSIRVEDIMYAQVGSLRKRELVASYVSGQRHGTYWGIWSDIANFELPDALPCPVARTQALAGTATRLAALDEPLQNQLINWGYAACDAALRAHVNSGLPKPSGFPYPGAVGLP